MQKAGRKAGRYPLCRAHFRVHLHFVKDDERLTLIQFHAVVCGQQHKEGVQIIHVLHKIVLHLI